ncbi:type II secretion system F family protein [Thiohalorhabdus sp. Cl-TMA]|uniref:Type II secretion system F family protein n=1 Tax=Thiohalorhabdus methylotrophus TaxID=3242694 RepID=A0ABV4U0D9_9GAMM
MATYRFRAKDGQGYTVTGTIEADSPQEAAERLSAGQRVPLEIAEATDEADGGTGLRELWSRFNRQKVTLEELILFSRQMATLLRAGVPLIRALAGQVESVDNDRLREALQGARETLEAGRTLSDGLALYPDVFSALFVHMVRVGESSGNLEEVFDRMSGYLEQEKDTRDRARQAVRYPVMVVAAIAVAFIILNVFVIPQFVDMFSGLDAALPLPTQILIAISTTTRSLGWLILVVLVGTIFAARRYIGTARGRYRWDRLKLRLPIVGDIFTKLSMARFTRTFAITSRSGVPVMQGLNVVVGAVGNRYVGVVVEQIRNGVERGDSLANAARRSGVFPATVLQMLEVGEETGALDEMMEQVAAYYEREADLKIGNLSALIEPVLIAVIGAMVLLLALGIFLPMWDMSRALG